MALLLGNSDDRWCTNHCSSEGKHTETQYLTWFGKTAYIHGRDNIILTLEKEYNKYMEEDLITQLPSLLLPLQLLQWLLPLQLSLSL